MGYGATGAYGSEAYGGSSDGDNGGDADAFMQTGAPGDAYAVGGNGATGNGGDAEAESLVGYAEAIGGESVSGDGGAATATGYADAQSKGWGARAFGGTATATGSAGTAGGAATATIPAGGTGDAYAEGGQGNAGGEATADMYSDGWARAIGGNVLPGSTANGDGGDAWAESFHASGTATATSGDAINGFSGLGGLATAQDLFTQDQRTSFTWQGVTANVP